MTQFDDPNRQAVGLDPIWVGAAPEPKEEPPAPTPEPEPEPEPELEEVAPDPGA